MKQLTDKELYHLCKKYGENSLMWRRKFIGLLPEVNRRRLYEKKGFASIFEFAKKLCGLSEKQVRLALNLEERFSDKPALAVTSENEAFWAEKVQQLPSRALETYVQDFKNENGLNKAQNKAKSLHVQTLEVLQLAPDVMVELLKLQAKGIDVNEVLREFLEGRNLAIALEKERLSAEAGQTTSRHTPVKIKQHLQREYGTRCSLDGCARLAAVIHHTQRFALAGSHNPKYLAPLCREHHAIAHAIDQKVQMRKKPDN